MMTEHTNNHKRVNTDNNTEAKKIENYVCLGQTLQ
jgi:hypothetical protein